MNHALPTITTGTPLWTADTIGKKKKIKAMLWKAKGLNNDFRGSR